MFRRNKPSPPSATVATDAVEQGQHVTEAASTEKDHVAETAKKDEDIKADDREKKKKPEAGLRNYFVRNTALLT